MSNLQRSTGRNSGPGELWDGNGKTTSRKGNVLTGAVLEAAEREVCLACREKGPQDDLREAIAQEPEVRIGPQAEKPATGPGGPKFNQCLESARAILELARDKGPAALAYSGGTDSTVLLDLVAAEGYKPAVIWIDTGMEYPETEGYVRRQVESRGLRLAIARPDSSPEEQWARTGWPMLGKLAARHWMRTHPGADFKINTSECCRALKIRPGRRLTKNLGIRVQLTGQRGAVDDRLRGLRELEDGAVHWQTRDKVWIVNPLLGWPDGAIAEYVRARRLEMHPALERGARTIGCVYCGGGSQFENSGFRVLRRTWPEAWRWYMVDQGAGLVVLALKYGKGFGEVQAAVAELGGLGRLADVSPWIFDFVRRTPIRGYEKGRA